MASSSFIFPNLAKLNFLNGATGLLVSGSSNYRVALFTSALTPNNTTNEVLADISSSQIAGGNGYTTGGGTLTSVTLSQSGGIVTFDAADFVWTASGGSIPAWRYAYVYYLGTLNGKVNPLVGYFIGDNTPADIPATTSGNTLTVQFNASGILSAT